MENEQKAREAFEQWKQQIGSKLQWDTQAGWARQEWIDWVTGAMPTPTITTAEVEAGFRSLIETMERDGPTCDRRPWGFAENRARIAAMRKFWEEIDALRLKAAAMLD